MKIRIRLKLKIIIVLILTANYPNNIFSQTRSDYSHDSLFVTGKPQSTGNYSANLSFIGLSFSYIFTGANKRLLKLYERNLN